MNKLTLTSAALLLAVLACGVQAPPPVRPFVPVAVYADRWQPPVTVSTVRHIHTSPPQVLPQADWRKARLEP